LNAWRIVTDDDDNRGPSPPPNLPAGRYRHYKGGEYDVYEVARHSETDEMLVVYRPRYGKRELWVRPLSMFTGVVSVDGRDVPRFTLIGAAEKSVTGDGAPP
jgi:hypothetical protein